MKLIIAGGGTGGHVFPGIAVAQALKKMSPRSEVLFVGTELGIETSAVPKAGFPIDFIRVSGIKGRSFYSKLRSILQLPFALRASIQILRRTQADAVLGVGGYASGPLLLAAWLLRIPIAICEPNSIPGFTNRVLGHLSRRIYGAFDTTAQYFPKKRFEAVGNPLREEFSIHAARIPPSPDDQKATTFQLVIIGGSLGAKPFNDVIPKTIQLLQERGLVIRALHQTGKNEVERVQNIYRDLKIHADVRPFINDMVATYRQADLLICRSGAATCAEITALGVPAIMVPFPHAIYDHQTENARELVDAGAAILLPQSEMDAERLAEEIFSLASDPKRRHAVAQAAFRLGKRNAAREIAGGALNRFSKNKAFK